MRGGGTRLCGCSVVLFVFTTLLRGCADVDAGGRQLSTVYHVVRARGVKGRRRLLGRLRGDKFRIARTALSHSVGRLGIVGMRSKSKGCMCHLPSCSTLVRPIGRRARCRPGVRFSNGLTIIGAHPKCTVKVTSSVSARTPYRVLNAVTKSSAVLVVPHRKVDQSGVMGTLTRFVWCVCGM